MKLCRRGDGSMPTTTFFSMRCNWIIGPNTPILDINTVDRMHDVAPIWSSVTSMQPGIADNLVCHDTLTGELMLRKNYGAIYNLYVPQCLASLGLPCRASYYQGEFDGDVSGIEDVICLHLVLPVSDIILAVGFDLSAKSAKHDITAMQNRLGMIRQLMTTDPEMQWILIGSENKIHDTFRNLPNVSCDTMKNVLEYFSQ